ncbi:cell envelope integrity protein TolA [Desulfomonile tiedjei]|uniref:TolA protein n=1 Tax=Desulfomonile tiedjei (strain ATCC 49306 / DSM 6799 / DCB-1) TaxID=706587 RepID=I4BZU3_DESTA|nr:cell envelope integrity protein TolA [Desulfomonile tiedjei]AFM22834.1 TolA protein [Desulfomonile tiedjei DSM 6799]
MTPLRDSSRDAASFWTIAASLLLHALFISLAVVVSYRTFAPPDKPVEISMPVRIVQEPGLPDTEKIGSAPEALDEPPPLEHSLEPESGFKAIESVRETIDHTEVRKAPKEAITLAKRKKQPLKVEPPKEPPKAEAKKKEEDPAAFLEKRMAALRKEVEKRKNDLGTQGSRQASGNQGNSAEAGRGEEELSRWLALVKQRSQAYFSVIGERPDLNQVTVIGIKISDSGALIDASIHTSSGDRQFDQSAMQAVRQASPYPPPSPEVKERIKQAGGLALRFTSRGIQ